jgi:hypothetical protein
MKLKSELTGILNAQHGTEKRIQKNNSTKSALNFWLACRAISHLEIFDDFSHIITNNLQDKISGFLFSCFLLGQNNLKQKAVGIPHRREIFTKFFFLGAQNEESKLHHSFLRQHTANGYQFVIMLLDVILRLCAMLRELTFFLIF